MSTQRIEVAYQYAAPKNVDPTNAGGKNSPITIDTSATNAEEYSNHRAVRLLLISVRPAFTYVGAFSHVVEFLLIKIKSFH